MAPLPTIGNCVRVGLRWNQYAGVRPYNVFHLITDQENMAQLATDIGSAMDDAGGALFGMVHSSYFVNTVDLTPLDGSTATTQHGLGTTIDGGTDGQPIMQVCGLVSLRTSQRGSRGRGRLYLGPVAEAATDGGQIADYGSTTTAWNDFQDALVASDSAASLGVASYTHAEVNGVVSVFCEQLAATQRRRMQQLRR